MENRKLYILATIGILLVVTIVAIFLGVFLKSSSGPKLLIDHDGGADDAMAIFIAILREKYFNGPQVIGLTTVNGNVNENQVFINTQRILDVAGRQDIPIYRGSPHALVQSYPSDFFFGKDGLGDNKTVEFQEIRAQPEHAVQAIIDLSKKYEGDLIIVTIGPLTNLAIAMRLDPGLTRRLKQLYVGAGNVYDYHSTEAEFNALLDVESYHVVAENAIVDKVTIIPFSLMLKSIKTTKEWRVNILGKINSKIMEAQNSFEQVSLNSSRKWQLLDPEVMSVALDRSLVDYTKYSNNSILLCGRKRGINTNDFQSSHPNVLVYYSASQEGFEKYLLKTFSAEIPKN